MPLPLLFKDKLAALRRGARQEKGDKSPQPGSPSSSVPVYSPEELREMHYAHRDYLLTVEKWRKGILSTTNAPPPTTRAPSPPPLPATGGDADSLPPPGPPLTSSSVYSVMTDGRRRSVVFPQSGPHQSPRLSLIADNDFTCRVPSPSLSPTTIARRRAITLERMLLSGIYNSQESLSPTNYPAVVPFDFDEDFKENLAQYGDLHALSLLKTPAEEGDEVFDPEPARRLQARAEALDCLEAGPSSEPGPESERARPHKITHHGDKKVTSWASLEEVNRDEETGAFRFP